MKKKKVLAPVANAALKAALDSYIAGDSKGVHAAEETTWRWFAEAHPHEAHATWPDRFWRLFQELRPGVSREEMERVLDETEREATQNAQASDSFGGRA